MDKFFLYSASSELKLNVLRCFTVHAKFFRYWWYCISCVCNLYGVGRLCFPWFPLVSHIWFTLIHSPPSSILGEALIYTIITTYPFALLVTKLSRIDEATFVPCSHRACTFMMLVSPKIVKADQSSWGVFDMKMRWTCFGLALDLWPARCLRVFAPFSFAMPLDAWERKIFGSGMVPSTVDGFRLSQATYLIESTHLDAVFPNWFC